ncbi:choice-of-anchor L domain-containing protein [bacterium]|nr:choice-of-anchor L domain-containing protein [bacterium]
MKFLRIFSILLLFALVMPISCVSDDDEGNNENQNSSDDSMNGDNNGNSADNGGNSGDNGGNSGDNSGNSGDNSGNSGDNSGNSGDNSGNSGDNNGNSGDNNGNCTPGEIQKCPYHAYPETEGVGPCKAGTKTCKADGTWGVCEGEVTPVNEIGNKLCADGIDNDCNGTVDDGTDIDGDGHGACSDCCELSSDCPQPALAWDEKNDVCEYGNPGDHKCDSDLSPSTHDPADYAKAIGICKTTTEDSDEWGLISARIVAPDGKNPSGSIDKIHDGSHGLLTGLGNVISAKGHYLLALTTGQVADPFSSENSYNGGTSSYPPEDWFDFHDNQYPSAPVCTGNEDEDAQMWDAVMFEMKIKVPLDSKSFSFKIYFLTKEYPTWICSKFNDFFVALLDSKYTSTDPTLKNPEDKNLALDASGNPVGVNLAPAGLFSQCVNQSNYNVTSCQGTEELQGTGFENNGGTGWLTVRGNVVGGEIITLRMAIWDLDDSNWDSITLIDDFKWDTNEHTPGIDPK